MSYCTSTALQVKNMMHIYKKQREMSYTVNEIYTQAPSHVLGCLWMLTPSEQW